MEKCECEKAKDYLEDTIKNPIQYHFPHEYGSHHLRDIMEAEMYYEERRYRCACRKRMSQAAEEAEDEGESASKKLNVSDVEGEDGSGSERETIESEAEEENPKPSPDLAKAVDSRQTLDSLLPKSEAPISCRLCELARASLAEGHVTQHAVQLFNDVKQNCSRCNGSAREDVACHCAENFEWTINFASKEEREEMGWDLVWELDG